MAVALLLALPGPVAAVLALPVGLLALVAGVARATVRGFLPASSSSSSSAVLLLLAAAVFGRSGGRVAVPALVIGAAAVARGAAPAAAAAAPRVGVAAVAVELAWRERGGGSVRRGGSWGGSAPLEGPGRGGG